MVNLTQLPTLQLIIFLWILTLSMPMSFRLTRNKQTCMAIPNPNIYNFQFSVAGQNPQQIACKIYLSQAKANNPIVQQITQMSSYETTLNITNENSRICFSSLDSMVKQVSFDIIAMNDPMRAQILQKDMSDVYEKMETLYVNMQKLYRNQHFYYDRNRGHRDRLSNMEYRLKIMKAIKITLIVLAGLAQYFVIKKLLDRKYNKSNIQISYQQLSTNPE